jgi:hypothetical protein
MSGPLERGNGLSLFFTTIFEALGILNKGSAGLSKGDSDTKDAAEAAAIPIVSTSLNVTRVGGMAAAIAGAGAAALALFNVDKLKDPAAIVVAAYASSGFIVGAALIAAALIISADTRSRGMTAADTGKSAGKDTTPPDSAPSTAKSFKEAWSSAVASLEAVSSQLPPPKGTRNEYSRLWLDAKASTGFTTSLKPPGDLVDEHARLAAGQQRLCQLLEDMTRGSAAEAEDQSEVRALVAQMSTTFAGIP